MHTFYNVIIGLHVVIALGLIAVILVQRGRSGGLIESLGGVESIFGTKTSSFFVKITVVLSILYFGTSISLAYLSKQKGKSVVGEYKDLPVSEEKNGE
ncbi:MAG: preprotein translocase subunit SecG [Candidatus Omnitrophica bacterium]|nr:preprotein translocase subunit SecG [Candidatus Omnitrophota bacterium]MBD3269229.1 preprotein translocase subunit SecG [Candidatus Omnitrophota bacterium]